MWARAGSWTEGASLSPYLDQIKLEILDEYARGRVRPNWGGIKQVELTIQFFSFCVDREWITRNPARGLKRPKLLEANEAVPYTAEEITRIIAACDFIGKSPYERLLALAMALLMRFAGLRISDVVTLSRDHINGNHLKKRAVKNGRWIRVELPAEVLRALEMLPRPKAATRDSRRYFSSETASLESLVKGAWRTLKAVFKLAKVDGAHPHRFRHTLASELLAKEVPIATVAAILADSEATVRKHYEKWTPEYQGLKDAAIRKIHGKPGTHLAHPERGAPTC